MDVASTSNTAPIGISATDGPTDAPEVDLAPPDAVRPLEVTTSGFDDVKATLVDLALATTLPAGTDGPTFKVSADGQSLTAGVTTPSKNEHVSLSVGSKDPTRTDGYQFTQYDGKGYNRTAVDPNSPYKGLEGPYGARTGVQFIQVPPYDGFTMSTTSPLVTGEGLADTKVDPRLLSNHLLPEGLGGRVLDQHNMGTPKEVYDALKATKTPEEYAGLLDKFGGTITRQIFSDSDSVFLRQQIFGVTRDDPDKVGLNRSFALGPYEQVATYMKQNPEVAKAAKEFSEKTGINAHVYAEWEFMHAGGGKDQGKEWPKEITILPNQHQLGVNLGTPDFAARAATYLKNNPDVAELAKKYPKMSPEQFALYHYSEAGRFEGRSMGANWYQGRQGTEEFEKYYFGDMTKAEASAYWNNGAGAGDDGDTTKGSTSGSKRAAGGVEAKATGDDASAQLELFAKALGLSGLTLKVLKGLTAKQKKKLLELMKTALESGETPAHAKGVLTEAMNKMLEGQKPAERA